MNRNAEVHDRTLCELGEGPLWHPQRQVLFWFDILQKRLFCRDGDDLKSWEFGEHVSAAGWVDRNTLLIASETALLRFDIGSGRGDPLVPLEADNPKTRSNDGRADPWGGFWIGTMGKSAEPRAGAIYRYYRGEILRLFNEITVSNAICFAPDRSFAYFADTWSRQIMRQSLDSEGWPDGAAEVFVDLRDREWNPDGAVVDSDGCLWVAIWGSHCVARFGRDGSLIEIIDTPAAQPSCPAFGGSDLRQLFITSAAAELSIPGPADGRLLSVTLDVTGQQEHRVILDSNTDAN